MKPARASSMRSPWSLLRCCWEQAKACAEWGWCMHELGKRCSAEPDGNENGQSLVAIARWIASREANADHRMSRMPAVLSVSVSTAAR